MPTAIVTLSCPHCGGRTDGVRSIEAPQTIPCPYCRTELHVPRIGERVIERVIERTSSKDEEPMSTGAALGWLGLLLFVVIAFLGIRCRNERAAARITQESKQHTIDTERQRAECTAACEAGCPVGRQLSEVTADEVFYNSATLDRSIAKHRCTLDCRIQCLSAKP